VIIRRAHLAVRGVLRPWSWGHHRLAHSGAFACGLSARARFDLYRSAVSWRSFQSFPDLIHRHEPSTMAIGTGAAGVIFAIAVTRIPFGWTGHSLGGAVGARDGPSRGWDGPAAPPQIRVMPSTVLPSASRPLPGPGDHAPGKRPSLMRPALAPRWGRAAAHADVGKQLADRSPHWLPPGGGFVPRPRLHRQCWRNCRRRHRGHDRTRACPRHFLRMMAGAPGPSDQRQKTSAPLHPRTRNPFA